MEDASKKRTRRGQIETALLSTLALAGIGLVAMAAPNTLKLLKYVDLDRIRKTDPRQRIREASNRLKKKGLIEFVQQGDRVYLRITDKGRNELSSLAYSSEALRRPKRWDHKWRLVIFDIPEKHRTQRDRARAIMIRLGFVRLQQSVWAYPYDCEEIIALLKAELHIGKDLLYIIADAIEYDKHLREQFDLPRD
ncbi:CRISPR-associated endonuclease Cas2 [Candidatus Kaiserbacteria bacterium]|nr:CRISPR-associated endonuclease Cas2 [Candidatus Kaiserbacteria bacterium]